MHYSSLVIVAVGQLGLYVNVSILTCEAETKKRSNGVNNEIVNSHFAEVAVKEHSELADGFFSCSKRPNGCFEDCFPGRMRLYSKAGKASDGNSNMSACARQLRRLFFCMNWCTRADSAYIYSEESGRSLNLSARELSLIEQSWMEIENKDELGKEIFRRVLLSSDKMRTVFDLHTCPDDELDQNETFKRHLKSLSLFLGICATSVNVGSDRLVSIARRIGEKHVNFRWVSFDAEYWLLMKGVMVDVIAAKQRPKEAPQVRNAWNKLLSFVIAEIKHSFLCELNNRNTKQDVDSNMKAALMQKLQDEWELLRQSRSSIG